MELFDQPTDLLYFRVNTDLEHLVIRVVVHETLAETVVREKGQEGPLQGMRDVHSVQLLDGQNDHCQKGGLTCKVKLDYQCSAP